MVRGEPRYRLIDDQIIAFNAVLALVRRAQKDKRERAVVVVKGGPGTGKSVIALNLLGVLSQMGANVQHATGSKAFTENLWRVLGRAVRRRFASLTILDSPKRVPSTSSLPMKHIGFARPVTIATRAKNSSRRARKSTRSLKRPKSRSFSSTTIKPSAPTRSAALFFCARRPSGMVRASRTIDLRTQFRCAGSDEYIDWVDQLLEIRKTGVTRLESPEFEVRSFERPDGARSRHRGARESGPQRATDGRLLLAVVDAKRRRNARRRHPQSIRFGGHGTRSPMRASLRKAFRALNFGRAIPAASIKSVASIRHKASSSTSPGSSGARIS